MAQININSLSNKFTPLYHKTMKQKEITYKKSLAICVRTQFVNTKIF